MLFPLPSLPPLRCTAADVTPRPVCAWPHVARLVVHHAGKESGRIRAALPSKGVVMRMHAPTLFS
ncbi:hypothetical protein AAW51_4456 [Caldimonas brevitalea]|uniref:Uncharacterized protein n=1 Tax=Caldimonas brevitalea TaxID=413882 RepID=A0A0G3BP12_9BURK|nr:hypothetical protein AAW51_4456 [Caldimonas brevitalea]